MRKARLTLDDILERTAPVGECLDWQGAVSSSTGYGKLKFRGTVMDAHRATWLAAHGAIPAGSVVMHACDNRKCVSLAHLSLGSYSDNTRDAVTKGRHRAEPPLGEASPKAKLTLEQVQTILSRLAAGEATTSIARDYGVDHTAISKIKHGVSWARALEQVSA